MSLSSPADDDNDDDDDAPTPLPQTLPPAVRPRSLPPPPNSPSSRPLEAPLPLLRPALPEQIASSMRPPAPSYSQIGSAIPLPNLPLPAEEVSPSPSPPVVSSPSPSPPPSPSPSPPVAAAVAAVPPPAPSSAEDFAATGPVDASGARQQRASSTEITALGISIDEQRRFSELYERLNRIDHYTLLGVSATDDAKAIKRAYFGLVKDHHPDRFFRKDVGALKQKIDAIFAAMTMALETLTDAERRADYDGYLRETLKTRIARRQALGLEAAKNWTGAAEVWARIVEKLPTEAYVQHRYAYALLRTRTSYDAAISAVVRAIELDATRAEYRVTAASLYLAAGHDRTALQHLALACEIEPDRTDIAALCAGIAERIARSR